MVFIANADARVSIVGSLFHNNSRTVDTATPDNDKPLCLYVGDNFVGSLDLTNTSFIANTWGKPVPAGRRREAQEVGGIDAPPPAAPPADDGAGSSSGEGGGFGTTAGGYGSSYGGGHNGGYSGYGGDGGGYGGYGGSPPPAEPEGDGGTPGDAAGDNKLRAWQTTVGIACGGGTTTNCSVTVTNSKFINNTGGLNSALYVLCQTNDPLLVPMRCNIDILTSSFEGNLLLDVDGNGTAVVEKGGPHSAVLVAAATASDLTTINANVAFSTRIINVDVPKMVPSADGLSSAPDWSSLEAHNEFLPPPVEVHARVSGCEFIGSSTGGAGVTVTAYSSIYFGWFLC
ncbi:hypothetical protein CHLRE_06g305302v5 [Chlamydomonas reinhardtii]|uniref:Uncharacterized protein n=1 Tax=Chlamydomonas reinhardtii TaxID=3055 RepID=A0A2K3DR85_CHLRE|nr:uncharacterized protein CHLRE_06g305302v5 [Chlamydomonas reinhardtii]PNW83062.1 hypothetical protein CHLRE_06g305302v5 [Chlamydomonas reinhardtii]